MKKNTLLNVLTMAVLTIGLLSCKKDKDDENQIEDGTALTTMLSWTVTDPAGTSTDVDLDIFLFSGTGANKIPTQYESSASGTSTEAFDIPVSMPDGDYTVTVDHYDIPEGGTMNFSFKAKTGSKTYQVNGIPFTSADEDVQKDIIKISKSGNTFTITKL